MRRRERLVAKREQPRAKGPGAVIDLRSDTFTKPSAAMREVIAHAEVGDDAYGEDPSVRRLEETVAALLGKEAALFVPSGTMANQLALRVQTRPGDQVIVGEHAHVMCFESAAAAALSGVQFAIAGTGGLFTAEELVRAVRPAYDYLPRPALVALENTHNLAGGRLFPQGDVREVADAARQRGLGMHLDGARLWNAHIATGLSLASLAAPFDTVAVCFSKGLGAPVGSALVGSTPLIAEALRYRKMFGGGMHQSGLLAAAAEYALEHHLAPLAEDHARARELARTLAGVAGLCVVPPETNIVVAEFPSALAEAVAEAAAAQGVLVQALGPCLLRAVTHRDVSAGEVARAGEVLANAAARALADARA